MTFTPSHRLYGLGIILLAALTICSRKISGLGGPFLVVPLIVAGTAYLLAIREFLTKERHRARVGRYVAHPVLLVAPGSDDDIHRHLWDGHLQRLGYDPYVKESGVFSPQETPAHSIV